MELGLANMWHATTIDVTFKC